MQQDVVRLDGGGLVALSPRDKLMLRRLAQGKTDHQIAVEIGGRQDQVALQRERLLQKLRIGSQEQLTAVALRLAPWLLTGKEHKAATTAAALTSQ